VFLFLHCVRRSFSSLLLFLFLYDQLPTPSPISYDVIRICEYNYTQQLICMKCVALGKHKDHSVVDVKDVAGGVRNEFNLVGQKADRLLLCIEKREREVDHDENGLIFHNLLPLLFSCHSIRLVFSFCNF
jgi:hypothetical protein